VPRGCIERRQVRLVLIRAEGPTLKDRVNLLGYGRSDSVQGIVPGQALAAKALQGAHGARVLLGQLALDGEVDGSMQPGIRHPPVELNYRGKPLFLRRAKPLGRVGRNVRVVVHLPVSGFC
jgi:hypothetical protein